MPLGRRKYDEGGVGDSDYQRPARGGHGGYHKRGRFMDKNPVRRPELELENMILRFGQQSMGIILENMEDIATKVNTAAENDELRTQTLSILVKCVTYLPSRITVHSTLIGLLNLKSNTLGAKIVERLVGGVRERLLEGEYNYAMNIMLFIADSVNTGLVDANSLVGFLKSLLAAGRQASMPQCRGDYFVTCVLRALVYAGNALVSGEHAADVGILMDECEEHIGQRHMLHIDIIKPWDDDVASLPPTMDSLAALWQNMQKFREDKFRDFVLQRFYMAGSLRTQWADALSHSLPHIVVPAHHAQARYPLPTLVTRIFTDEDVAAIDADVEKAKEKSEPGEAKEEPKKLPTTIERYLMENDVRWILHEWHTSKRDTVKALVNYPLVAKMPWTVIVVETVFSEMLRLPHSPVPLLAYASICVEMEKAPVQGVTATAAMQRAAWKFYESADKLQPAVLDRVIAWLAFYLSHHQLRFDWDDMKEAASLDIMHPRRYFAVETLQLLLNLFYSSKLPQELAAIHPPTMKFNFKYLPEDGGKDLPGATMAEKFEEMISQRVDVETILDYVREATNVENGADDDATPSKACTAVDAFVSVLLNMAARTPYHTIVALTKYGEVFKALVVSEETQRALLDATHTAWVTAPVRVSLVLDKFVRLQVLECSMVIEWFFTKADLLLRRWTWEFIEHLMHKLPEQLHKMRRELQDANDVIAELQTRVSDRGPKLEAHDDIAEKPAGEETNGDAEMDEGRDTKPEITYNADDETANAAEAADQLDTAIKGKEALEQNIEQAKQAQADLLLTLFQNLVICVTEHVERCAETNADVETPWFAHMLGRIKHMFLHLESDAARELDRLQEFLFSEELHPRLLHVFKQFKALRQ